MIINKKEISTKGIRLFIEQNGKEISHAYLYLIKNDLHAEPYGLLEDVFVNESSRGSGLGTGLINEIIKTAKENGCYKIVATSRNERPKVHALYEKFGFKNYGLEFRMNLN